MKKHLVFLVISLLSFVLCPSSASAQIPSYVPTSGLVGWWPFNGNANDESGNGNNGTVNGATLTTDRFGVANKAYSFDGVSNYISVTRNYSNSFSVSMWFNTSATQIYNPLIDAFDSNWEIQLKNSSLDYVSFIGVSYQEFISSQTLNNNNWYHLVCTYNSNIVKFHLNGNLIEQYTVNTLPNNSGNYFLGASISGADQFYNGKLDDIAIYNRALTQQEISNLYTNSGPPSITTSASPSLINCGETATLTASSTSAVQPCTKADLPATLQNGLVGYWPFCGNANDASGNGNNGTVNGATLTTDRFGNAGSAYSFDGVSNYIQVNSSSTLNCNNALTIGAWVYNTNIISGERTIISRERYSGGACSYRLATTSTTNSFGINNESSSGGCGQACNLGVLAPSSVITGAWQYVTGVWDGVTCKIYINGILVNTANGVLLNGNTLLNSTMPLFIGKWMSVYDAGLQGFQYFNGKIDDIAIYNRALSASEIQQLYNLGNVTYSWSTGATTPSITVTPTQTTSYTCTATNSSGSTTSSVTVSVADTLTWTGSYDTDWHKPCNWSPQFVPKCCNNVAVPLTTNQPIVSGVAASEDLTIYTTNGAQVTVNNSANLQIADCPTTITTATCPSLAVITTTAVSSITQTTAVSGGTITYQGASAITARGVCWGTSPNPTIANSLNSNGTGIGTFTSNLTGLVAGTTYYVRAYATNGSGTSYGNNVSFVTQTLAAQYPAGSVFCASGPTAIVDVTNPSTGKTWMDRNLGATQVATSSIDAAAYGDLYQWGRGNDGHQCRTSATTTTLSSTDQPGNGNFILSPNGPNDWRSPQNTNLWQGVNGVNNPCPSGYRVPTDSEIDMERASWVSQNNSGAFLSVLKLVTSGIRNYNNGLVSASSGNYWTSTISGIESRNIQTSNASIGTALRGYGLSVRCIKDASVIPATIGTLNCGSTSITGTLTIGTAASSVSASVPYTAGNGGSYVAQTISSTGVTGLTATLASGILANGNGSLSLTISGTPSTSGTASFALTIGGQNCSFTISVQTALAGQYPANSVFCASGPTLIVDVTNPTTGKTWMDRNLGATQVATSSTDAAAYGDLYQWGRGNDGHQCRTSATTTTLSSTDSPGNGNFILAPNVPYDWRSSQNANLWQGVNGVNNPCPNGYRIPTEIELDAERLSWIGNNSTGAFASPLKFPMGGLRIYNNGSLVNIGISSGCWGSTISSTDSRGLDYNSTYAGIYTGYRANGVAVRCIKN